MLNWIACWRYYRCRLCAQQPSCGFIRWAISPVGKESAADFDDNVFFYTCRESGPECIPADKDVSRYAADASGDNTIFCGDTITLPTWLDEGDCVLQWIWFGVGGSYGNYGWAEPQFISCANIKLTSAGTGTKPECPTFVGGDRVTKNENLGDDQCFYCYTNSIVSTVYKGSNSDYQKNYVLGKPSYVENCSGTTAQAAPPPPQRGRVLRLLGVQTLHRLLQLPPPHRLLHPTMWGTMLRIAATHHPPPAQTASVKCALKPSI
ncbi:unnamed protein product [Phytophthora lilii]|uniref:Unnamed protein product n=1 Tax=Phytophthora lilii TaxID=2077276 RepID=A0A9W6X147_9STRA|nr:unnamed protein product [Phytophthora lilii]